MIRIGDNAIYDNAPKIQLNLISNFSKQELKFYSNSISIRLQSSTRKTYLVSVTF